MEKAFGVNLFNAHLHTKQAERNRERDNGNDVFLSLCDRSARLGLIEMI